MIEVFSTNVQKATEAKTLVALLAQHFPDHKINFDLDDRDKILRVEGHGFTPDHVMGVVQERGFLCAVLE